MSTNLEPTAAPVSMPMKDPRDPFVADPPEARDVPPTAEEWERLAVQEGLYNLIRKYGAKRVATWVRTLATIAGESV